MTFDVLFIVKRCFEGRQLNSKRRIRTVRFFRDSIFHITRSRWKSLVWLINDVIFVKRSNLSRIFVFSSSGHFIGNRIRFNRQPKCLQIIMQYCCMFHKEFCLIKLKSYCPKSSKDIFRGTAQKIKNPIHVIFRRTKTFIVTIRTCYICQDFIIRQRFEERLVSFLAALWILNL